MRGNSTTWMSDSFMAVKDVFKVSRKTFFDPRAWLGYDRLKATTGVTWNIIKGIFVSEKPINSESFVEATTRLGLTPNDVKQLTEKYKAFAYIFMAFAIVSFCAGIYFLIHHQTLSGCLLGLAVTAFFLAQWFRYSFWHFQLANHKLGCTFNEWMSGKINSPEDLQK